MWEVESPLTPHLGVDLTRNPFVRQAQTLCRRVLDQGQLFQLKVAAGRLTINRGDRVALGYPRCGGRATGRHRLYVEPRGQPCLGSRGGRYRYRPQPAEGVGHLAGGDDLICDGLGQVARRNAVG